LEGSINNDLTNDSTPSTAKPKILNGRLNNQMKGYKNKTRRAIGQQTISNISQSNSFITNKFQELTKESKYC